MSCTTSSTVRYTYRLFNEKGEKLATAVTYQDTIFQVAPEKKSFPNFEAWKAEHPSNTNFTEHQDLIKNPQPSHWRPYRNAKTASLRHLTEYKFQFPGKDLFLHQEDKLVKIHYTPRFDKAFAYTRNPDNSLEVIEFISFTELGSSSDIPNLWVSHDLEGIQPTSLEPYIPAEGKKEAFVLVAGRNTSVLAAQDLKKNLEDAGILVHYGLYDKDSTLRDQLWMGSPYVFKVEQTLVNDYAEGKLVYKPLFSHMRTKPWKKDLILNIHPKPEDHKQKGLDAALEIVCGK
jgi:hypothetical protein